MPANPNGSQMASPVMGDVDPTRYQATTWGSAYVELEVPSGQLCLVQRLSTIDLIEADMLDDFDMLSKLVQTEHVSKKSRGTGKAPGKAKQAESQMAAITGNKENLKRVLRITNAVVMKVVVQPHIWPVPEKDDDGNDVTPRLPGRVYVDTVEDNDKSFIMSWAFGGTSNLERFREELSQAVDGMADGQDVA